MPPILAIVLQAPITVVLMEVGYSYEVNMWTKLNAPEAQNFSTRTRIVKRTPSSIQAAAKQDTPGMRRKNKKLGFLPQTSMSRIRAKYEGKSTRFMMMKLKMVLLVRWILSALKVSRQAESLNPSATKIWIFRNFRKSE